MPALKIMPDTTSPARGSRNRTPRMAPPEIWRGNLLTRRIWSDENKTRYQLVPKVSFY